MVGDVGGRLYQFVSEFEGDFLAGVECRAGHVSVQVEKLFSSHAHLSAHGRVDVHSKQAADMRRGAGADKTLQLMWEQAIAIDSLGKLSVAPEDLGMVGQDL